MKRALLLVVPLALTLVACSDDDDDPEVTAELDVTIPDISIPEITIPDISIPDFTIPDNISIPDVSIPNLAEFIGQLFPQLDDEQIDCLADAAEEIGGEVTNQGQLLEYLDECNIDASDLVGGG